MATENPRSRPSERGQAIVMATIGVVFLFSVLGLVVDLGYNYFLKQQAQAAVDSAVTAGAVMAQSNGAVCGSNGVRCESNVVCPTSPTNPPSTNFDSACLYAQANGATSQTVTISAGSGSASGIGVASNYWISATSTQSSPLWFLRTLGLTTGTVSAQATSALIGGTAGGCIYVLDPNLSASYNQPGTTTVNSNCGIYINSSASDAFTVKGNGIVTSSVINVVGGSRINNNATVTPGPTNGVSPFTDPLASLPAPTYSGCNSSYLHVTGGTTNLTPGVYCGGIQISSNAVVNFAPGNYILNGGGLQVTSSMATLNGSGVMFYNTSNGYTFGSMVITGNATINLTAPSSGTYQGILVYQDRSITASPSSAIGGGSNENFSGTVYLPTALLSFAGGSSTNALTMALVVKDIDIVGNSYLNKDATGQVTGLHTNTISLVQ